MKKPAIEQYKAHYTNIGFERADLFRAISESFRCEHVLYPGSFIHTTPSFFFPHVVYVDQNPIAKEFFDDLPHVLQFVSANKKYKRSPYIRFLDLDYCMDLPLVEGSFDLLISLYSGDISQSCKKYLKTNGVLLTNAHFDDTKDALKNLDWKIISVAKKVPHGYKFMEFHPDKIKDSFREKRPAKEYVRRTATGIEYRESEDSYYLFRKSC